MELSNRSYALVSLLFAIVVFGAYLIPQWYAFFVSHPFLYTNAWDNANYLCYQGALGARSLPGYAFLYVVTWLQQFGVSGAVQNLIYDSIFPALTAFFVYKALVLINIKKGKAFLYALLIIFSGILFNYGNIHMISWLGPPPTTGMFVSGWESYPAIIRAPNPQFSYFLVSLFTYLSVKLKRKWFLAIPLPFIYYFVLIPYLFILCALCGYQVIKNLNPIKVILINLGVYLLLSFLIYILFNYMLHENEVIRQASNVYVVGRKFYLPIVGCFGLVIYLGLKFFKAFQQQGYLEFLFITLIVSAFAITNFQLVTGFALDIKNFQGYGNGIIAGLLLVLTFEIISRTQTNLQLDEKFRVWLEAGNVASQLVVLFLISKYMLLSQGFSFVNYNFSINIGAQFNKLQIEEINQDPLHSIVIGSAASQMYPYGFAKMLAPVFSYQYNYKFVMKQCQYNQQLAINALNFIQKNYPKKNPIRKDVEERAAIFFKAIATYAKFPYSDRSYCNLNNYASNDFKVIVPEQNVTIKEFPDWSRIF